MSNCDDLIVNIMARLQPSRELAEQTYNQIVRFKKYLESPKISVLLVVGGINIKDQISALSAGVCFPWSTYYKAF